MTDPLDRLSALRSGTLPPLPGAAAARARGRQRTRRTRSALAGAAAALAVVSVSAVSALAGGTGERVPPPVASTGPAPEVTPVPVPPFDPETGDLVAAALLTEQDVREAYPGAARVEADPAGLVAPLPCARYGDEPLNTERSVAAFETAPGPVTSLVLAFAGDAEARLALGQLVDGVEACEGESPEDPTVRQEVVGGLPGTGPDRVWLVHEGELPRLFTVLRVGRLLSVVQTVTRPEADVDAAARLADRARDRAAAAQSPSPSVGRSFDPSSAYLSPEDAASAEQPGWAVGDEPPAPEPLADPCGDGDVPEADAVLEAAERTMASQREAGGSSLAQEVYEYRDLASSAQALAAYAAAYERCPSSPSGESSYELLPVDGDRLLVRRAACPAGCAALFATYTFVVRSGYAVTVAEYAVGEDGDPAESARRLLDAVTARLNGAVEQAEPPVYFTSPTGGITCAVSVSGASCDTSPTFTPPPRPADCEFDWGSRVTVDEVGARFVCHSDALGAPADPPVLPYGETYTGEAFACSSSTEGVRCTQRDGDAGFLLSRGRYDLS